VGVACVNGIPSKGRGFEAVTPKASREVVSVCECFPLPSRLGGLRERLELLHPSEVRSEPRPETDFILLSYSVTECHSCICLSYADSSM